MVLGGLWHGANFTFLFWGLYHGLGLSIERWVRERPLRLPAPAPVDTSQPTPEHLAVADDPTVADGTLLSEAAAARTAELHREGVPDSSTALRSDERSVRRSVHPAVACFGVFQFVTLGWIFFRAQDLGSAFAYLWALVANWGVGSLVTPTVILVLAVGLFSQFIPRRVGDALEFRASQLPPVVIAVGVGIWLVIINLLGPQGVAPFIYFQF
jgi:hypothetical protein